MFDDDATGTTEEFDYRKVNKLEAENSWDARALFNGFKVRVVLTELESVIEGINRKAKLTKRLTADLGPQGGKWFIGKDKDDEVVYLESSVILLTWKMTDNKDFRGWFKCVETHTTDEQELEWQAEEDIRKEKEAEERRQRELEKRREEYEAAKAAGPLASMGIGVTTYGSSPKPTPVFNNTDIASDWEFCWDISTHEHSEMQSFGCRFYFREVGTDGLSLSDIDLSAMLNYEEGYGDDDSWVANKGTSRDIIRSWLLSQGFSENPEILYDVQEYEVFTKKQVKSYWDVVNGKITIDEIKGLGWTAYVPFNPKKPPSDWDDDYDPMVAFDVKSGDNDQYYPFELGDMWYEEVMECHAEYEGDPADCVAELKAMGFKVKDGRGSWF